MEEETRSWWLDESPRRSRVGDTGALYVSPTTGAQPPYHRLSDSRELIHRIARSNVGSIRLKATEVEWRDFEREFMLGERGFACRTELLMITLHMPQYTPYVEDNKLPFLYFTFLENSFRRETISTLPAREPRGKNDVDEAPANFVKYECNRHYDALHASLWASAFVTDLLDERSEQEFHTRSTNACRRFIAFIYMFPACIVCARVVGNRTPAVNRGNARNHLERCHSLTIESNVMKPPGRI
ncbi:hypothetical protein ALC57_11334 [Trachymyrmex cornetzi]|uniref:Uncharacterized protein n=1 Tax=Trachymyrmex cornetzi TaxID=471704 RepID=A0A195DV73_9HYME|nr:hypothetical protein ALC57_11334 [Trachymyrmex cornetzi]